MTDAEKINLKSSLKQVALDILHERIENAAEAMKAAQRSANEVEKSSVGDKYETARSMAQLERDIHARQMESAQKELSSVQPVDVTLFSPQVDAGSYVQTDSGNYFFLAGIGEVNTGKGKVYFISIHSPIGKVFSGRRSGEQVRFNGKEIKITEVF
jgi:transcription elongation GreA/GreB family factor